MSEKTKESIRVMTPKFRVSFPNLFKPKSAFEGQEPVYSVQMLIPKDTNIDELKRAAKKAATKKFGDELPKNFRWPFKNGNEKNLENYKDMIVIEARSKMKPGVVDRSLTEIIDAGEVYAGCWARATLVAYGYDKAGNRGVSFGLQNLQKVDEGEAFSGRSNAKDDFDALDELDSKDLDGGSDDGLDLDF